MPVAGAPIADGWIGIDNGRITAVGHGQPPASAMVAAESPFGQAVAILPGLINAHTHLELSYLRGHVPPKPSFGAWMERLVATRRGYANPLAPEILDAIRDGIAEARRFGTSAVGDISNTLATVPVLRAANMPAHVFHEVLGFNLPDPPGHVAAAMQRVRAAAVEPPGDVRVTVTAHAPYSVSPALFRCLAQEMTACPSSVHLGESPEETALLRDGSGPIPAILQAIGVWNPEWTPPGCGPLEYVERLGLLSERLLVVHGVHLSDAELALTRAMGATLVTCPRSNRWVGVGDPPVDRFYASGARVAIGTDSLASVDDLNVFAEMAQIRRLAPRLPARSIIESATRHGADALGFGDELGTIEPGKRAALVAVRIPEGVKDVEEYLLTGITQADVRWVEE